MPERPRFPGRALLGWLTINAHLIVVGALFGAFGSSASKLGMAGVDGSGIFVITAFFLGRLYQWNHHKSHLNAKERPTWSSARKDSGKAQRHRRASAYEQAA